MRGEVSLLGEPSRELVLEPPGDVAFGVEKSSEGKNRNSQLEFCMHFHIPS